MTTHIFTRWLLIVQLLSSWSYRGWNQRWLLKNDQRTGLCENRNKFLSCLFLTCLVSCCRVFVQTSAYSAEAERGRWAVHGQSHGRETTLSGKGSQELHPLSPNWSKCSLMKGHELWWCTQCVVYVWFCLVLSRIRMTWEFFGCVGYGLLTRRILLSIWLWR